MVLETKYGSPKIVNDGVTIAREVCGTAIVKGIQQRPGLTALSVGEGWQGMRSTVHENALKG